MKDQINSISDANAERTASENIDYLRNKVAETKIVLADLRAEMNQLERRENDLAFQIECAEDVLEAEEKEIQLWEDSHDGLGGYDGKD